MIKIVSVLIVALLLSACSSLPDALESSNEQVITDYQQWVSSPLDIASEVRLGGIIANVKNLQQRTRIEVVNMPINSAGKPDLNSEPEGRYVAYYDGYLESMSLAPGRLITFLGTSSGKEEGKVDDFDLTFPVMEVKSFHLWRIQESVVVHDIDSHLSRCYGIHCRGSRGLPSRGTVVQEVK